MTDTATNATTKRLCIIGGGASGVGLAWCLARARQLGMTTDDWQITLLHDGPRLGGHSDTVEVTMGGQQVQIDLGVQMIAPAMYPAVSSMLALPDFADVVLDTVDLRLACAFPQVNGATPYWGNFTAYQDTDLYRGGQADCATYEALIQTKSVDHTPLEWLEHLSTVLDGHRSEFSDLDHFEQYFLDPYMSIMNGYGAALLDGVILADVAPLWDLGLASMTQQTTGFGRFRNGAGSWVQKMGDVATSVLGGALDVRCNAAVTRLQSATGATGPTVTWAENGSPVPPVAFDAVVSTLDMWTISQLLADDPRWSFYEKYIGTTTKYGTSVWDLQPGYCFLHQDPSVLAPGLQQGNQETLQFTASYSGTTSGYDLSTTFTTYIESNLLGVTLEDPREEWYLTMYGYDPTAVDGVPLPKDPHTHMQWEHGMWLPSFMVSPKLAFHGAQSSSPHATPHPEQEDTGIFFAGNNLTMDSEEGAFVSALAIAKYAFGLDAPKLVASDDTRASAWAEIEFDVLYELMFPPRLLDTARRVAAGAEKLLGFLHPLRRTQPPG